MAEALAVVGAVAAVLQLSDTGLNGIGKLKDAYKHYHRRSTLLDRCQDELQSIKSLVELVKTESALHTAAVARALNRLKGPEEQLEKWLTKVSTGNKSAGHNFLRELTHGSDDRKQLKSIMKELDQANHHLDSVIQIRHVEMSRKSAERDVANRKGKREGGPKPRERLGKAEGANRATPGRGHIVEDAQWSDSGIASTESDNDLSSESEGSDLNFGVLRDADGGPEYVKIRKNVAEGNSRMYNAPMQKGKWQNMRRYEAEGNRTKGSAEMYNYEMSIEEYASIQAENRKRREWELDQERKQKEWELDYERQKTGGVSTEPIRVLTSTSLAG